MGEEARENGLKMSLLERLHERYQISPDALHYCARLLTNYRCHKGILDLSSRLFYDSSLQCRVPEDIAHPAYHYPLMFYCSSDDETAVGSTQPDESELRLLIEQVAQCTRRWPASWGKKDLQKVCIVAPTYCQVNFLYNKYYSVYIMLFSYYIDLSLDLTDRCIEETRARVWA